MALSSLLLSLSFSAVWVIVIIVVVVVVVVVLLCHLLWRFLFVGSWCYDVVFPCLVGECLHVIVVYSLVVDTLVDVMLCCSYHSSQRAWHSKKCCDTPLLVLSFTQTCLTGQYPILQHIAQYLRDTHS